MSDAILSVVWGWVPKRCFLGEEARPWARETQLHPQ